MLPNMIRNKTLQKQQEQAFYGLDHNNVVQRGYFYDMRNMTGDYFPVMAPRKGRVKVNTIAAPNGLFVRDRLCWVDGTNFVYDGVVKGTVSEDLPKRFARLGVYVLIWPDRVYYNTAKDEFGKLEAKWEGAAAITSYDYDAESAEAGAVYEGNAIRTSGDAFPFEVGEAIFVSGSSIEENNRSAVIRDILEDGKLLVFSNNTFQEVKDEETEATSESGEEPASKEESLTIERKVPDMDFFCENENRLWGCKGNDIYASALGNPFRWNNYEGLATDSYAVSVGTDGDFTGAVSYLGYAVFFKEDAIHKVYGSMPSNYQVMSSAVGGVAEGCGDSIANAGETLFYLGRNGIVSYTGGLPTSIAAPFGTMAFDKAVGGSDGRKYYVSLHGEDGWAVYVYDTRSGLWHKEDETHALGFAKQDGVLYLLDAKDNGVYAIGQTGQDGIEWMAETGDFYDNGPDKEGLTRLQVRLEVDGNGEAEIYIQYDSDGEWRIVKRLYGGGKSSHVLPIVPRRCDHFRLRFKGVGGCKVYSVAREFYRGSER